VEKGQQTSKSSDPKRTKNGGAHNIGEERVEGAQNHDSKGRDQKGSKKKKSGTPDSISKANKKERRMEVGQGEKAARTRAPKNPSPRKKKRPKTNTKNKPDEIGVTTRKGNALSGSRLLSLYQT